MIAAENRNQKTLETFGTYLCTIAFYWMKGAKLSPREAHDLEQFTTSKKITLALAYAGTI